VRFIRRYLIPRLIQWVAVTVLGITIVFFLPRLMPVGPVERAVAGIQARGEYLDPEAAEETIRVLEERRDVWFGRGIIPAVHLILEEAFHR